MSRVVTLAGFAVLAAGLAALEVAARWARRNRRVRRSPTFGELVDAVVQRRRLHLPVLVAWLWLGWHLFARVDWR